MKLVVMMRSKRIAVRFRLSMLSMLFILSSMSVHGGRYFVVVGTFSEENSASSFAAALRNIYAEASVMYDDDRRLYYVHVMETDEHVEAQTFGEAFRNDTGFANVWVFADVHSPRKAGQEEKVSDGSGGVRLELFNGGSVLLSSAQDSYLSISKRQRPDEGSTSTSGMNLVFSAETYAGTTLSGKISFLWSGGEEMSAFESGEIISLGGKDLRYTLTVMCRAPGYHPEVKEIDLTKFSLLPDISRDKDGVWKVRFALTRIKVDEVNLLYRNMFYPEAAVFDAEAKNEIDVLLTLMLANTQSQIVVNAHCNPGGKRMIAIPGSGSDPFDVSEAVERSGTDKTLSRVRGETVRDYLVAHGIDGKRIKVMGWGSMDPLVDPAGENSRMNDRIEVEFRP